MRLALVLRIKHLRPETLFLDRSDDSGFVGREIGLPPDSRLVRIQADSSAAYAGDSLDCLGDMPGAVAARHPVNR
jgi:hypothetical protein